ncbi:transcriptional regulator, LysR family [Phaeobacter inhibens]|uniref:Transcriptional regulator, LysR family n=1 Tax=Phaeobacter inhibens TaxID=221822 RepID=A0ABM6RAS3_9RHOB|nr:LysR family transcriptional regulator [Phaeobacter inhibens]AUQ48984.1 transcriptional regulator, LysR family [Phaeobacter inhibens]AUQ93484.1 transcriptional regulator, LysR family [Phaeobacter inhibens]AUR18787.1 transcriptional regulator, LysR family [Phaeobacter inhibens]
MDIRFLSSLVTTIEEGSLAAAARREGITASAISQRIAALEADVGVVLLCRAGRVMQPTAECRRLLPKMREILRAEAELRGQLRGATLSGTLRLGAVSTAMGDYAGTILRQLRQAAPEVALQLVPGTSEGLYALMQQGQVDAALLIEPPFALPKAYVFKEVARQPIGLLQAEMDRDGPSDEALPFLIYSRDAWGGARCWQALTQRVDMPDILAELDALELIAQMVAEGTAQAVVPLWEGLRRHAGLRFNPFDGEDRRLGVLLHQRDADSALTRVLLGALTGA